MFKKKSVSFGTSTDEKKATSAKKMKDVDLSAVTAALELLEEEKQAEAIKKKKAEKESRGCGCW